VPSNPAFRAGRYREALSGYQRIQELNPAESASYYNAARCYLELDDQTSAARMYYSYLLLVDDDDPDRKRVEQWLAERQFPVPQK